MYLCKMNMFKKTWYIIPNDDLEVYHVLHIQETTINPIIN